MSHNQHYQSCIDACLRCASVCNHCASSCLQEHDVSMMTRCIQLDMGCAASCYAAGQVISMNGADAGQLCRLCAEGCQACGEKCPNHEPGDCRECGRACQTCAEG